MSTVDPTTKLMVPESLGSRLFAESGAEKFGFTPPQFTAILQEIACKYLPASAGNSEASEFLSHLRLEELALARACAAGHEKAWDIFLTRYREKLFGAAHSMVQNDANARELADSLYAELYGTRAPDGNRASKLSSFTGRGSLEGWLRAVLAQEHVNRIRREQRAVSLEEQEEAGVQFEAATPDPTDALDARLIEATDRALAALAPEEKFILTNYYLDDRTLAETARLMGVHESTVSRKVEKITTGIRKSILASLMQRGMSRKEAEQTMDVEVTQIAVDVRRKLMQEKPAQSVPTIEGAVRETEE